MIMKTIKTLFATLLVALLTGGLFSSLHAQQILFEDFSGMTDSTTTDISGSLDNYTQVPGWTGNKVYQSNGAAKIGTSSVKGYITTPALDLSGNGGNFTIRFKARRWTTDQQQMKVFVNETEHLVQGLITNVMTEFTVMATGGTSNTLVKFEGFQAANSRFFIDDIEIFQSTDPALILSPSSVNFGGIELNGNATATVTVRGANLTSDDIQVAITGNGFTTTTTQLATSSLMTEAGVPVVVNFNPTAVADYTGTLTFTGGGLANPVTLDLSGSGINITAVSTLAELRAAAPAYTGGTNNGTAVYKYTGEAIVTHMQSFNNVKYIQDATAAIMIYDPTGKISGVEIGEKITNVMGTLTNYYGMIELVPTTNCTPISAFNSVTPTEVTLADLDNDHQNSIQSKLIKLPNVTVNESGNWATGKYYGATQAGVSKDSVIYTDNFSADYINTAIPSYIVNLTGICLYKGGASIPQMNRIVILNNSNNGITTSIDEYNHSFIKLAPNPASQFVRVQLQEEMNVEIYSMTGALLHSEKLSNGENTISVSSLTTGLYILRFTDNSGKQYNSKLQIQ